MSDQKNTAEQFMFDGKCYQPGAVISRSGPSSVRRAVSVDSSLWENVLIREWSPFEKQDQRESHWTTACYKGTIFTGRDTFIRGYQAEAEIYERLSPFADVKNQLLTFGERSCIIRRFPSTVSLQNLLSCLSTAIPLKAALQIAVQLTINLQSFHRRGLLHLDVSPARVYLLPGKVLLLDYHHIWEPGQLPGKEKIPFDSGYAAPQLLLGNLREVDTTADLYAVCAILFHLLTGRRLRDGEAMNSIFFRNLPMIIQSRQNLPAATCIETAKLLQKGLYPLAHRRFSSAIQLQQELQQLASQSSAQSAVTV